MRRAPARCCGATLSSRPPPPTAATSSITSTSWQSVMQRIMASAPPHEAPRTTIRRHRACGPRLTRAPMEITYQRIFESTPDALLVVDQAGRITVANAQAESLFGYSRSELIGQPVEMLVPPRFAARHVDHR